MGETIRAQSGTVSILKNDAVGLFENSASVVVVGWK
jgi:hypothetical protein